MELWMCDGWKSRDRVSLGLQRRIVDMDVGHFPVDDPVPRWIDVPVDANHKKIDHHRAMLSEYFWP